MIARVDVRERLHLVRANHDAIALMLARALAAGLESALAVVVVVVDRRDEVGKELAELAAELAGLNATEEGNRAEKRGDIPTMILVVDLRSATALFGATHPRVAAGLARAPLEGCVRVVAVAAGGAMLVHSEIAGSFAPTPTSRW
jgi:hypothetical protein